MIKATYTDKALVIDILCQSFDTNTSVNYVVKQDAKRKGRIKRLMEYSFELCFMFGQIYLSKDKNACALTLFPEQKRTSLKSVLLDVKMGISTVGLSRVMKILRRDSTIKSFYPKQPVLYLWFIGVFPSDQRKGLGSTMLNDIITESKGLNRPIYLETSMLENLNFYKNAGFDIYKELDFGHKLFLLKKEV